MRARLIYQSALRSRSDFEHTHTHIYMHAYIHTCSIQRAFILQVTTILDLYQNCGSEVTHWSLKGYIRAHARAHTHTTCTHSLTHSHTHSHTQRGKRHWDLSLSTKTTLQTWRKSTCTSLRWKERLSCCRDQRLPSRATRYVELYACMAC
jgi:hypothetical protein